MKIQVNGKRQVIQAEMVSLTEFLRSEGLDPNMDGIAVAINLEVVPRSEWQETMIQDGDEVEVITALQGG